MNVECVDIMLSIFEGKKVKDFFGCSWCGVIDEEFDVKCIE